MFPIPRTASLTFLLPQTLQSFIKSNLVFYVFLCFLLFFGVFFAFFIFFEFTSPRVVLPTPSWPKPKLKKNLLVLCDKKWKNHIFILYLIILHIFAKKYECSIFLNSFFVFSWRMGNHRQKFPSLFLKYSFRFQRAFYPVLMIPKT